jgi:DNA-binding transcriptional LysR family regulator
LAVAELHSFSMAANRLGLSTQAVSQLVAELETHLQFRLFDRNTRRVTLSSAGRDYLPSAQTLMRHVQETEIVANNVRQRATGVLRIAAPQVLACTALPLAIKVFQEKKPRVVVRICDVAVDQLVDQVAFGDVDLALGPDRAAGEAVHSKAIFDSAWVLWCAAQHPLAKRRRVNWAMLREHALVAAGYDHEHSVAQMRKSLPPEARIMPLEVVMNISTALGIAAQGKVATLAPAYVAILAKKFDLVMRRVVEPETVRKVCLYSPTNRTLSPAAEGFAEHLISWLPRWSKQ